MKRGVGSWLFGFSAPHSRTGPGTSGLLKPRHEERCNAHDGPTCSRRSSQENGAGEVVVVASAVVVAASAYFSNTAVAFMRVVYVGTVTFQTLSLLRSFSVPTAVAPSVACGSWSFEVALRPSPRVWRTVQFRHR